MWSPFFLSPYALRTIFLLALAFLTWLPLMRSQEARATAHFQAAQEAALRGELEKAVSLYEQAIRNRPGFLLARRNRALLLSELDRYEEAAAELDSVLSRDSLFSRAAYFQAGLAHYKAGNLRRAQQYFRQFEALQGEPLGRFGLYGEQEEEQEETYLQQLPMLLDACRLSLDSGRISQLGQVSHLGKGINSPSDEYFPFLSNSGKSLFFTRRKSQAKDEDLYISRWQGRRWGSGSLVGGDLNSKYNEGMSTFVRNGRIFYFTACGREGNTGPCDIWEGRWEDGKARVNGRMQGLVNSPAWESQAAVSCDGSALYFASLREGGFGGSDIWVVYRNEEGRWGTPVNLGPKINTAGDEEAPFITNDGNSLFFSSTGHHSLGENDIFLSWRSQEGQWTRPMNLGPPVNSPHGELGFFLSADNRTGFFASDRPGGEGGMDLYRFELPEAMQSHPITFVEGKVFDNQSLQPVSTKVYLEGRSAVQTDAEGRFFLCVPAEETLDLRVLVSGYAVFQEFFLIPEHDNAQMYTLSVPLQPLLSGETPPKPVPKAPPRTETPPGKKLRIEYRYIVYFDFDSQQLSPAQLEKMKRYLEQRPDGQVVQVEIAGYADDIGEDSYNLRLSEERAKSVALFLQENGVQVDHIFMQGLGELHNDNPKQENRRVEVRMWIER